MIERTDLTKKFDLGFTQNDDWQLARSKRFSKRRESLKEDFRVKKVRAIEHYFMTGQVLDLSLYNPFDLSNISGLIYFPLVDDQSFRYFFCEVYESADLYRELFYETLAISIDELYSAEESLVLFDFFHNDQLVNGVNKSLHELGCKFELDVSILSVATSLYTGLEEFVDSEGELRIEKILARSNYYLEAIREVLTNDKFDSEKMLRLIGRKKSRTEEVLKNTISGDIADKVIMFNDNISTLRGDIEKTTLDSLFIEI